jgi:general secretion pathway protein A
MYTEYFGFSQIPFSITPDPRLFYNSAFYQTIFSTLRYGIEARKGFILVTGAAGTGKTTLLRKLMRSFDSDVDYAFVINPHLDFTALLQTILKELGVTPGSGDKLVLLEELNNYIIGQHAKGHTVALLIDEAQALSDEVLEELRLLCNLETDSEKLIQIVLMGQPELEGRLDNPKLWQLKQRIALRRRMAPLAGEDVARYIESRLNGAGYQGQPLFEGAALERIVRYSKGIPRLINVICDNALVIACESSQFSVSAAMIDRAACDLHMDDGFRSTSAAEAPVSRPNELDDGALPVNASSTDFPDLRAHRHPSDSPSLSALSYFDVVRNHFNEFRLVGSIAIITVVILTAVAFLGTYPQRQGDASIVRFGADRAPAAVPRNGESAAQPRTSSERAALENSPGTNQQTPPSSREAPSKDRAVPDLEQSPPVQKRRAVYNERGKPRERFWVVATSFVRNKPTSDAEIIEVLQPGIPLEITSKTGEYFHIRSLQENAVDGFVHEEDAFFQRMH